MINFYEMTMDELLVEVEKEIDRWGTLEYESDLANALVNKARDMQVSVKHEPDGATILSCKDNLVEILYFRRDGSAKRETVDEDMGSYRLVVDMIENYVSNKDAYSISFGRKDKIDAFDGEYRFLSNFYNKKPFNYNGMMFWSSEAAFQAQKCVNEEDKVKLANCKNPSMAKKIGRGVKMRDDWNDIRVEEMYKILRVKFSDPELKKLLLDTGSAQLIEGNRWHDNYWGACTCDGCKAKFHNNKLGKTLMRVREEMKWEE